MIKNALILALAVAAPALAGTSGKAPMTTPPPAPTPANISYDFFQAGWVHTFIEGSYATNGYETLTIDDADLDGYAISFSKVLAGNLYFTANFQQSFGDTSAHYSLGNFYHESFTIDIETIDVAAGLGYFVPLTNSVHWFIQLAGAYTEQDVAVDGIGGDADAWGGIGTTGFRISLASWLELNLAYQASLYDVEDSEVIHAGTAALIFRELLAPGLDVVLSGTVAEDIQSVGAGLRYNF